MAPTTPHARNWKLPFFAIWVGQAFSLFGSSLVQFALVWWLTAETGSATVLATASLAATLPQVVLGPFAGVLVDRWSRRAVMIGSDALVALAALAVALLSAAGALAPWHIYVAMLVRSLGGAFHWPAMQASTSLMVPDEHLSRVAGFNQTLQGAMNIAAPAAGALLVGLLPLHGVLAIDIGTAILAILPVALVAIPRPARQAEEGAGPAVLWRDMLAGLRYMWSWPGLCMVGGLAVVINMVLSPAFALMPILVTRHFGGGALQFGAMESAWGVGVVLGGLTLGVWGGFRRRMLTSLVGIIGLGVGTLAVGLAPATVFALAVAGIFLAGFMSPIANGPLFAVMQARVAPEMQGRIFTLVNSMAAACTPLGLAVAGPVADAIGVQAWFNAGGLVCIVAGVGGALVPAILYLEDSRRAAPEVCSSPTAASR